MLTGLAADDSIAGLAGADCLLGGAGADVINAVNRRRDVVDCGTGTDRATVDRRDRVRRCERVTRRR